MIRTGVFQGRTALGAAVLLDESRMQGRALPAYPPIVSPYFEQMTRTEGGGRWPRRVWPESGQDGDTTFETHPLNGLSGEANLEAQQRSLVTYCKSLGLSESSCAKYSADMLAVKDYAVARCEVECEGKGASSVCLNDCQKYAKQDESKILGIPMPVALAAIGGAVLVAFLMRK